MENKQVSTEVKELSKEALFQVLVTGNIANLTPAQKLDYTQALTKSLGLNPLGRPFQFISFQGKEMLYATKDCSEQLRKIHRVSVEDCSINITDKVIIATAKVRDGLGRVDTATGVVPVPNSATDIAVAIMKAECVPVTTEILTMQGFKSVFELNGDEIVASYNLELDCLEWTPLIESKIYPQQEVLRYENNTTCLDFTRGHKWVDRGELKEFEELNTQSMIKLSSNLKNKTSLLTPQESACLGWIITDGTIKSYKGKFYRASICQSKTENFDKINWALSIFEKVSRGMTDNRVHNWLDQHWWHLTVAQTKFLFDKVGFESLEDLPRIACHLSFEARASMLEAMMMADGDKKHRFGKTKLEIIETVQILATLNGIALSTLKERWMKNSTKPFYSMCLLQHTQISRNFLVKTDEYISDVWCPTTKNGTWIMRSTNGQIAITGNTKAKRRATLSICGLGILDESELDLMENQPVNASQTMNQANAIANAPKVNINDPEILPPEPETFEYEIYPSRIPADKKEKVMDYIADLHNKEAGQDIYQIIEAEDYLTIISKKELKKLSNFRKVV